MTRKERAPRSRTYAFLIFAALTWLQLCLPDPSNAQIRPPAGVVIDSLTKVNQLNEVQVSRIKISKRQTSSTPLQILSGTELEKLSSLSVADAVRFFSGVQLKDYGGIGGLKTINVRSMGSNHTAVFYDGVQLGNAQNGQVDLGKFSLDNIGEIELYNGQKSSIFQSAKGFSSASSLYMNSKLPEFAGRSDRIRTSLKTGSFGMINPSLLWQHKISDHIVASLSTEWKRAHGRYKFRLRNGVYDTTAVRENAGIETGRIEVGLNGQMADSSKWSLKFYGYADKQGLPGAIVSNVWNFSQRLWNKNFFVQSTYEKNVGRYSLKAIVKYANDYMRYLNPDNVGIDGLQNNVYKQQEGYLSLANKFKINNFWDVVWSADYQLNKLDANLYQFAYPVRSTLINALATQLHFEKIDIQANLLSTLVDDKVERGPAAGSKNEIAPTVMVSWQPFNQKEFRLRSFYKHIFRMPTFNDLYYTFYNFTVLKPEYTKQYDLGFTYIKGYDHQLFSQFSVQADAYFNQVKDKIIAVPSNNIVRWSMQNIGRVEIKGIDLNVQSAWQINNLVQLSTGIAYTYQKAVDADRNSPTYNNQIAYIPLHNVSFLMNAAYGNIAANYSFIYTGERYNQSANNIYNYVRPWYTHDFALHYHANIQRKKIIVTAEVNNLLNQDFEVITNFPMPGRSYRCSLTYNY